MLLKVVTLFLRRMTRGMSVLFALCMGEVTTELRTWRRYRVVGVYASLSLSVVGLIMELSGGGGGEGGTVLLTSCVVICRSWGRRGEALISGRNCTQVLAVGYFGNLHVFSCNQQINWRWKENSLNGFPQHKCASNILLRRFRWLTSSGVLLMTITVS